MSRVNCLPCPTVTFGRRMTGGDRTGRSDLAENRETNGGGCERCEAPLGGRRGEGVCPACAAYAAGQIATREGMCFYVMRAAGAHLGAWLAAVWVPSRIVETHVTFEEAGAAAARLNRRSATRQEGLSRFYFVSTDTLSITGHGGDSAGKKQT